jgi:hypothetical protein
MHVPGDRVGDIDLEEWRPHGVLPLWHATVPVTVRANEQTEGTEAWKGDSPTAGVGDEEAQIQRVLRGGVDYRLAHGFA